MAVVLAVAGLEVERAAEGIIILEVLRGDLLRCMRLLVINAENNAEFRLSRQEINLFIAVIVLKKQAIQEQEIEILEEGFRIYLLVN